ncbi:MAG: beta-lactamase family protein [Actinomycetota bacterium]|nr:beta-lactamase family protein [Actinomycetota bacterium]
MVASTRHDAACAGTASSEIVTPAAGESAGSQATAEQALRRHFASVARRHRVPGIAYGVVLERRLAFAGAVGVADVSTGRAAEPVDPSRLCSMTKSFVAAAALILRDAGAFDLDEPIDRYVPDLESLSPPTTDSPAVTVRSLLTMSSGLPTDDPWADRCLDFSRSEVDALFARGATFAYAPGVAYEYSNFGWVMLGRAVSNVTGVPAQRFVEESLLAPLGLRDTSWSARSVPAMVGHHLRGDEPVLESRPLDDGDFAPMAGLWSTAIDVSRWMSFFLDAFPARDDPEDAPLRRSSRREMQQLHRLKTVEANAETGRLSASGYGFGLVVEADLRFGQIVGHPGGLPGFGCYMRWLPDRGAGVVALANRTYAPVAEPTLEALAVLDDLGVIDAQPAPPSTHLVEARDHLVAILNEWNADSVETLFAPNVFLDASDDARRREAKALREEFGALRAGDLEAQNATCGSFRLHGERGSASVHLLLTPEVPPRIQRYEIRRGSEATGTSDASSPPRDAGGDE